MTSVLPLLAVTLPNRPQLRMLTPDSEVLREAVQAGELLLLDQPEREPQRAVAHQSARQGPRVTRL